MEKIFLALGCDAFFQFRQGLANTANLNSALDPARAWVTIDADDKLKFVGTSGWNSELQNLLLLWSIRKISRTPSSFNPWLLSAGHRVEKLSGVFLPQSPRQCASNRGGYDEFSGIPHHGILNVLVKIINV